MMEGALQRQEACQRARHNQKERTWFDKGNSSDSWRGTLNWRGRQERVVEMAHAKRRFYRAFSRSHTRLWSFFPAPPSSVK